MIGFELVQFSDCFPCKSSNLHFQIKTKSSSVLVFANSFRKNSRSLVLTLKSTWAHDCSRCRMHQDINAWNTFIQQTWYSLQPALIHSHTNSRAEHVLECAQSLKTVLNEWINLLASLVQLPMMMATLPLPMQKKREKMHIPMNLQKSRRCDRLLLLFLPQP